MTKLKVERMTCQNTCSSWITYQKDAEFTWMCQFSDWRSNWRYCWKLQSYQKIKGCIPTNNQRWSSQTRNLQIRVIQWIKIEDQPQQILRVRFKIEFVMIYKRTTPKIMISDVLKNYHLEGAALSLVRSVDNIDEIWQRLKSAYGDPKLLLKKIIIRDRQD